MRLSYVIGSILIICILLLGATYMISRNQSGVPGSNAQNSTQIITENTKTTNSTDTTIHSTYEPIINASKTPVSKPTGGDSVGVSSGNGHTMPVYYCLQYATDKYVTDANVTLYTIVSYNQSIQEHDLAIVDIPGNPLHATNAFIHGTPVYQFDNVPYGDYIIRAERNGKKLASGPYGVMNESGVFVAIIDNPSNRVPTTCKLNNNTIYGWTRSLNGDNLANVKVSLMRQQSHADTPTLATDIKNNPTYSAKGEYTGFYSFEDVPPGWYTISIEYQNKSYYNTFKFSADNKVGWKADQTYYWNI